MKKLYIIPLMFFIVFMIQLSSIKVFANANYIEIKNSNLVFDKFGSEMKSSYLEKIDDGYMRVQSNINGIYVIYYDNNFKITNRIHLENELSKFGTYCSDNNYYYIITGEDNTEKIDEKEIVRISKYNKEWNKIDECHIYYYANQIHDENENLIRDDFKYTKIFYLGSCRTTFLNNDLVIHTSTLHSNGHQYSLKLRIDTNTMTCDNKNFLRFATHSFNQFPETDGNQYVILDHADASPARGLCFGIYDMDANTQEWKEYYYFGGENGDNYTGAYTGDLKISSSSYLVSGSSIDQSKFELGKQNKLPYNVFVMAVDKETKKETIRWFTDYTEANKKVYGTTLTPIGNDKYMLLWSTLGKFVVGSKESSYYEDNMIYYTFINGKGEHISQTYSYKEEEWSMGLSDCHPIYDHGNVIWYSCYGGVETLYQIPVNNPEKVSKTTHFYPHEWIGSSADDIDLTLSKNNVRNHIPYEFKDYKFYEWEKTSNGYKCYRIEYNVDDPSITRKIEVPVEESITKSPTCSETGTLTYTAKIVETYPYYNQTITEEIPVNRYKHSWGDVSYEWNEATCKATRVCKNDTNHIQTINLTCTEKENDMGDGWYQKKITASGQFPDGTKASSSKEFWHTLPVYTWKEDKGNWICNATRKYMDPDDKYSEIKTEKVDLDVSSSYAHQDCSKENECIYDATGSFSDGTILDTKRDGQTKKVSIPAGTHCWDEGIRTDSSCTEDGIITYTCQICDQKKTEVAEASSGHDYEVIEETPSTCTKEGKQILQCKICKEKTEKVLPTKEHEWDTIITPATCTKDGKEIIHCLHCDAVKDEKIIKATGHHYEVSEKIDATCTKEGKITSICSSCKDVKEDTIPVKEHTPELRNPKEASCKEKGYTGDTYCKDCNILLHQGEEIEKTSHKYNKEVINPTCKESGKTIYTCEYCKASYEEPIPKTDEHTWIVKDTQKATCTKKGSKTYQCSVCGKEKTEEIPLTDHQWSHKKKESTCTQEGQEWDECVCGLKKNISSIPKTNHIYEKTILKEANCTEEGTVQYTCKDCRHSYTETIKIQAHTIVKDKRVEPTTTSTGLTEGSHCSVCQKIIVPQEIIPKLNPKGNISQPDSIAHTERQITSISNDGDPAGSKFCLLQLRAKKTTKNSNILAWTRVKNASGYIVYGNMCGGRNRFKPLTTVQGTSWTHRGLRKGTYYKYIVVAYRTQNGLQKRLASSKTIHVATLGGKVGNYKSVKVNKKSIKLKRGKTFKIKAKCIPYKKKLKVKKHRKTAYESSNPTITTVSSSGKVKGKKKGICYIYVYSQSGTFKKIKVTVK